MPMYEYACRKCGHSFEKLVKSMSSTEAVICPECKLKQTDRKLSVFAVSGEGASGKSSGGASGDLPMCGRCGGPGPCAMN